MDDSQNTQLVGAVDMSQLQGGAPGQPPTATDQTQTADQSQTAPVSAPDMTNPAQMAPVVDATNPVSATSMPAQDATGQTSVVSAPTPDASDQTQATSMPDLSGQAQPTTEQPEIILDQSAISADQPSASLDQQQALPSEQTQDTVSQDTSSGQAPTTSVAPAQPASEQTPAATQPTDQTAPGPTYTSAGTAATVSMAGTPSAVPDAVKIESLLEKCVQQKASDLHIQVGLPPILRVDGALTPIPNTPVLTADMIEKLIFATLDSMQRETLSKDKEFDYSFSFGEVARFRVNAFNERGNLAAAFRLIPTEMPTIEQLGMPQIVSSFADYPRGLVLVTGPTGSGKSTTLAALINKINMEKAVHIITVEDPIEFTHTSKRSVVVQREVHYDTFSFARALKSILREDPDVVLVGEMRDLETISAAITIAETGHLVFATLHTNSAAQSIDRMVDVFPAHQQPQIRSQLSNILMAICAQRLVPAIDGGRVVAAEIMVANPAVRSIIREGKTHQLDTTIQTGANEGMQTMDRTLAKLVQTGVVTYDAAHEYAVDIREFERLTKGT